MKSSLVVSPEKLKEVIERMQNFITHVRDHITNPEHVKSPPSVSVTKLAKLLNRSTSFVYHTLREGHPEIPSGEITSSNNGNRRFSLEEVLTWQKKFPSVYPRPAGAKGIVTAVSSLKGGGGKTFTAVTTAQRCAMAGRKTLLIDGDPQGSSTLAMSIVPETDVGKYETLTGLFLDKGHEGYIKDIRQIIRPTYWPGLDIIPANLVLFYSELLIAQRMNDGEYALESFAQALDPIRDEYDVILIDCAPSMSPLNLNIAYAADGLLVPLLTDMMSFASNCTYWKLFETIIDKNLIDTPKEYAFLKVFPMMTRYADSDLEADSTENRKRKLHEDLILGWCAAALPEEIYAPEMTIPNVEFIKAGFMDFKTPYDIDPREADRKQLKKVLDPLERFFNHFDEILTETWKQQVAQNREIEKDEKVA